MAGDFQTGMQCAEVEALLSDALDGTLNGPKLAAFEAHQHGCATCQSMVEEARTGMNLLKALEVAEPPRNLVHNILATTIGALPSEHLVAKPRGEEEGPAGADVCAGSDAALCDVAGNGVLLYHHDFRNCRVPFCGYEALGHELEGAAQNLL